MSKNDLALIAIAFWGLYIGALLAVAFTFKYGRSGDG